MLDQEIVTARKLRILTKVCLDKRESVIKRNYSCGLFCQATIVSGVGEQCRAVDPVVLLDN